MNIHRIIQEAINNALKYASATKITVDFNYSKNQLTVKVIDDGQGFDLEDVQFGNGINNMKKRAHEINGEIVIVSNVKHGTSIQLQIQDLKENTSNDV